MITKSFDLSLSLLALTNNPKNNTEEDLIGLQMMEREQGTYYISKTTASGPKTFLLGGFLNAANKVPPVETEEYLHKKSPLVWEDMIF